ncbi:MAG: translation initiation factor [Deltaproteobacteria bacterium]|nr:translation initiation factor [Deltaproteobacteria bacterium]
MGKKKKAAAKPTPEVFSHNPFAALGGVPEAASKAPQEEIDEPEASPPSPPTEISGKTKVVVRREKKGRGGKTVTRVTGLPQAQLPALGLRMKKALGCGAVVEGDALVLLGSLVDRAADWLEAEGAEGVIRGN